MFNVLTSYLDNGLKILLKKIPEQKTISCGVWINQGSKNEDSTNNGISHLVEHLMFKTKSKNSSLSMYENLEELLSFGAQYNGTTTKDYTCFYIEGLSKYFNKIIAAANKRLDKMSSGQFLLQCRDITDLGNRGPVGLD